MEMIFTTSSTFFTHYITRYCILFVPTTNFSFRSSETISFQSCNIVLWSLCWNSFYCVLTTISISAHNSLYRIYVWPMLPCWHIFYVTIPFVICWWKLPAIPHSKEPLSPLSQWYVGQSSLLVDHVGNGKWSSP